MSIQIHIEGYDSLEQVAVGGMAAVYKARKISIDKTVAVKVLFPYLASDQSFIERFQREAKSAARVQHENIVNVLDFGESGGCYFIVMEFYEGSTIADLLKARRQVPLDVSMAVLLDVCYGLEAAHSAGIVHRDIKPANIIYTKLGAIKIADFGLAKKSGAMTVVTQPGKVLGTPAYMSPEQAAGEDVGPQSDIFSLGVVAFELFANKRPFDGNSYSEVLEQIQTRVVPPLSSENPLIQANIEDVINRMLEKDTARRYESVGDIISDLERAMEQLDIRRDRRRLKRYMADQDAYTQAFNEKMINKSLSQGTYYMQKGETHIEDAVREFRRILYLDPQNERARNHLARLRSEHPDHESTVVMDTTQVSKPAGADRAGELADGNKAAPAEREAGEGAARAAKRKAKKHGRSASVAGRPKNGSPVAKAVVALVVVAILAGGGWWGYRNFGGLTSGSAPVISSPARLTVSEGEEIAFKLSVTDADGDEVVLRSDTLPEGAALSGDGEFHWRIGYDQAGRHELVFHANDGVNTNSASTIIEVAERDTALRFDRPGDVSVHVGKTMRVPLRAVSAIGAPVEFELAEAPRGVELQGRDVTWVPKSSQAGVHNVRITGNDGVSQATQTLVVRVTKPAPPAPTKPQVGRIEWVLPQLANIYVDGDLKVRENTFLSIDVPKGRHVVRAELLNGYTVFEETINVKANGRMVLDSPRLAYGRLSVYYLGGVGELELNGHAFSQQPPFSGAVLPAGRYRVVCRMVNENDTREFDITVKEGGETVLEYEVGKEPAVSYEPGS